MKPVGSNGRVQIVGDTSHSARRRLSKPDVERTDIWLYMNVFRTSFDDANVAETL